MKTNEELIKELEEAKKHIADVEKQLKERKKEIWQPRGGEYFIGPSGNIYDLDGAYNDHKDILRENGVKFETKEAAEKAYEFYRFYHRLYKLAEECNSMFPKTGLHSIHFDSSGCNWYSSPKTLSRSVDTFFTSYRSVELAIEIMNRAKWRLPEL